MLIRKFILKIFIFLGSLTWFAQGLENQDSDQKCLKIEDTSTCQEVAKKHALDLTMLEEKYNCKRKISRKLEEICLSDFCELRFEIKQQWKCDQIQSVFKITKSEIEKFNHGVNCKNDQFLPIGLKLCIRPLKKQVSEEFARSYNNMTCKNRIANEDWNSSSLEKARQYSMTIDEFEYLNPDHRHATTKDICAEARASLNCVLFKNVEKGHNCEKLAYDNSISLDELKAFNPTLRCDEPELTTEVCIALGYYPVNNCVRSTTLYKGFDCSSITYQTLLSREMIEKMNPNLDCDAKRHSNIQVCVESLGIKTEKAQDTVMEQLGKVSSKLANAYDVYRKNRNNETAANVYEEMRKLVYNDRKYKELKNIYNSNDDIKSILDIYSQVDRKTVCNELTTTSLRKDVKDCFCDEDGLLIRCQVLSLETIKNIIEEVEENKENKTKPLIEACVIDKKTTIDCAQIPCNMSLAPQFPIRIITKGQACYPELNQLFYLINFRDESGTIEKMGRMDESYATMLEDYVEKTESISTTICITESEVLEALGLPSLCWNVVGQYSLITNKFSVSAVVNIAGIATAQINLVRKLDLGDDFMFSAICERDRFFCKDYCQGFEEYGSIEIKTASILGFDGITFYKKQISDPTANCSLDQYRVFITHNYGKSYGIRPGLKADEFRTDFFKYNRSGNTTMRDLGISFNKNALRNSEATITVARKKIKVGSFPYFGQEFLRISGQKSHRKISYFHMNDTHVMFGTEKGKENILIQRWDFTKVDW